MSTLIYMGLAFSAALLAFCVVAIICSVALQGKLQTAERMAGLRTQSTSKEKTARKGAFRKLGMHSTSKLQSQRTRKQLEKLGAELYDAGLNIPVENFLITWAVVSLAIPAVLSLLGLPAIVCIPVAVVCAFLPILYMDIRKKSRRTKIENQLVDAIMVLISAIKAGHSFQSALADIANDMEAPISEEFGRVFRETQRGMGLDESMERMADRVGSDDLAMLCTAVSIQRQIGGNLSEVLENIAATVKARLDLRAEIKTRTASGRVSGYIIGALPILILVAVSVINPSYVQQLFAPEGRILLVVAAALEVTGFIVINKVVSVKY